MNGLFPIVASCWLAAAPPVSLDAALEREQSLLVEETRALEAAIRSNASAASTATGALEKEIEALSSELARLQTDNAARELKLPQKEQTRASHAQHRHLTDLLEQMNTWLLHHGSEGLGEPDPAALVDSVARIVGIIQHDGSLQRERERYFDGSGASREDDVLRVGQVAAVRWEAPSTPLVRTPSGLQVVEGIEPLREVDGDTVRVRVVLHDPTDPPDPRSFEGSTWAETMESGGSLMWILLALGILASALVVERSLMLGWVAWRWRVIRRSSDRTPIPRPAWLAEPWRQMLAGQGISADVLEDRVARSVLIVRERLSRRMTLLSVVAAVAPLVGLLGTVSGMITTFSVVTSKGTDDPQLLAGGISQALLTTQFGLAIAIPAVVAHAMLSRVARRIVSSIEHAIVAALNHRGSDV